MTPTDTSVRSAVSIILSDTKDGLAQRNAGCGSKKSRTNSIARQGLPRLDEQSAPTVLPLLERSGALTTAGVLPSPAVKPRLCRMYAGRGSISPDLASVVCWGAKIRTCVLVWVVCSGAEQITAVGTSVGTS